MSELKSLQADDAVDAFEVRTASRRLRPRRNARRRCRPTRRCRMRDGLLILAARIAGDRFADHRQRQLLRDGRRDLDHAAEAGVDLETERSFAVDLRFDDRNVPRERPSAIRTRPPIITSPGPSGAPRRTRRSDRRSPSSGRRLGAISSADGGIEVREDDERVRRRDLEHARSRPASRRRRRCCAPGRRACR